MVRNFGDKSDRPVGETRITRSSTVGETKPLTWVASTARPEHVTRS